MIMISAEDIKLHKEAHYNEDSVKRFLCKHCPYSTNIKTHMKIHILVHSGERPHKCNICNRGFTQLHVLKRHMLIHTGEKPYSCKVCNKSFRQASHLKLHMCKHF